MLLALVCCTAWLCPGSAGPSRNKPGIGGFQEMCLFQGALLSLVIWSNCDFSIEIGPYGEETTARE